MTRPAHYANLRNGGNLAPRPPPAVAVDCCLRLWRGCAGLVAGMSEPYRFLNGAHQGPDGRVVSYLHCSEHPCTDLIKWPDETVECMMCARDRQVRLMTDTQRRNIGFNMPRINEWVPL